MESDSEENNETISGDNKNINESSSNIEINDVQASHPDHHHPHPPLTQEIPIVPQNNIEVGNTESDEVVVEAKRRRKSPPVQIRYSNM